MKKKLLNSIICFLLGTGSSFAKFPKDVFLNSSSDGGVNQSEPSRSSEAEQSAFLNKAMLLQNTSLENDFSNYLILDERVSLEHTKAENIITVSKGTLIEIRLGKSLVQFSYDAAQENYIYYNPWRFEQEGNSLELIPGLWEDGALFTLWPEWDHRMYQKIGIAYQFRATSLNVTTLTFIRNNLLYKTSKQLTFRINVVEGLLQCPINTSQ